MITEKKRKKLSAAQMVSVRSLFISMEKSAFQKKYGLNDRNYDILMHRLVHKKLFAEVAMQFNLSTERVRQIFNHTVSNVWIHLWA